MTLTKLVKTAISGLCQWATIYISHIQFRRGLKAQGIDYKGLPFLSPGAPYLQYLGLVILLFIFGCEFYLSVWPLNGSGKPSATSFFSSYLAVPLFLVDFLGYKVRIRADYCAKTYINSSSKSCGLGLDLSKRRRWISVRLTSSTKKTAFGRQLSLIATRPQKR